MGKWQYVYHASGGAHSTAMILKARDEGWPIDLLLFYDHGFHRPEAYKVVNRLEDNFDKRLVTLYPRLPDGSAGTLEWFMADDVITGSDGVKKNGRGWPRPNQTWCCNLGRAAMRAYERNLGCVVEHIGICYQEKARSPRAHTTRTRQTVYPLKSWRITKRLAVELCYERGYDWDGLYDRVDRCRCWGCPLERKKELYRLWNEEKGRWRELERLDTRVRNSFRIEHGQEVSVEGLGRQFRELKKGAGKVEGKLSRWIEKK